MPLAGIAALVALAAVTGIAALAALAGIVAQSGIAALADILALAALAALAASCHYRLLENSAVRCPSIHLTVSNLQHHLSHVYTHVIENMTRSRI